MNAFIFECIHILYKERGKTMSLRERKKLELRRQIVEAAQEIFLTQGFAQTTIVQIAQKVNIGVGTFYNYFSSKSELFLYIFSTWHAQFLETMNRTLPNPNRTLFSDLNHFIDLYINSLNHLKKESWKEFFAIFTGNIEEKKKKKSMDELIAMDLPFLKKLKDIIAIHQEKENLLKGFSPQDGAEAIYGIFMAQFILFLYYEDQTVEELRENLLRQVRLFLNLQAESAQ